MKSSNYMRKSAGAVLGLIAGLLLVMLVIGVFMYFGGRLLRANNQLTIASDNGILQVARQALVEPRVALNDASLPGQGSLPYSDFVGLGFKQSDGSVTIGLDNYNRIVAQAVLVARCGQIFQGWVGLPDADKQLALQHVTAVATAVRNIGQALAQKFAANGALDSIYDQTAAANPLSALGLGANVNRLGDITPASIGIGRPANVFIYPSVFMYGVPQTAALAEVPQCNASTDPLPDQSQAAAGDALFKADGTTKVFYTAGYTPIDLTGGGAASTVSFITNYPGETAHLVDSERAENGIGASTLSWLPPNTFIAKSNSNTGISPTNIHSVKSTSQVNDAYVSALSCASIGASSQVYAAAIPLGFVRIKNGDDMVLAGNSLALAPSLGPLPAPNEANAADASNFILNNEGVGSGSQGALSINVGIGTPPLPDGSVDLKRTVFTTTPKGLVALAGPNKDGKGGWIGFNNSRLQPSDPNYNADVISVMNVNQHRDINLDPMKNNPSGNSSVLQKNWSQMTIANILEGPSLNQAAYILDLLPITDEYLVSSLNLDGITPITSTGGKIIGADIALQTTMGAAAPNLGRSLPAKYYVKVPANQETWTGLEALKYYVMAAFAVHAGSDAHFNLSGVNGSAIDKKLLTTGMKYFAFFKKNKTGKQVYVPSPNNGSGGTPTPPQFMTIATSPVQLLDSIANTISNKGGYQAGQITETDLYQSLSDNLRLANAQWTINDVKAALATPIAFPPGKTLYLRAADDGSGKLILTDTCPQDNAVPPVTPEQSNPFVYGTLPGQYINVDQILVNTPNANGLPGDDQTEIDMWRNESAVIPPFQTVVNYSVATGYGNLLSELDFLMGPPTNLSPNLLANPN